MVPIEQFREDELNNDEITNAWHSLRERNHWLHYNHEEFSQLLEDHSIDLDEQYRNGQYLR